MNSLVDKGAVIFLCLISFSTNNNPSETVTAILVSIILSSLGQSFDEKVFTASAVLYFVLCFAQPVFLLVLPVAVYDILCHRKYYFLIPCGIAVAMYITQFDGTQIMVTAGTLFLSVVLQYRTSQCEKLKNELISTRDHSQEVNLLLSENNRQLRENQDYEISLATLKERNRIAREIHDNVGHMLTRSILQVGALCIINKDESMKDSLESIQDTLNNAMTSIRNSVHNLHDDSIDLRLAIKEAVRPMSEKYEISCDYDLSDNIPKDVKLCFIGIIKESLSNIVKHSNGNKVTITLREHPAFYQLSVEDNGKCGKEIGEGGIGLSNMRERAENSGGIITFTPSVKGFKVFTSIPKHLGGHPEILPKN